MKGVVRTKEKCPKCKGPFQGEPLRCPSCLTEPRRFYLDIYWPGQGKIKLYSGQDGHPLESWERAHRLLTAIRYEIDRGKFDPRNYVKVELRALRFENYAAAWLGRKEAQGVSREYLRSVRSYLRNHIYPFFGRRNIRDIGEGLIEDFILGLSGLSQKTKANIIGCLRQLLGDARRRRDIGRLPAFPKVEVGDPETRWVTVEAQGAILSQVANPILRAFFLFLAKQAWRPGEARALRWDRVDMARGIVVCAAAMDQETFRPHTKERDVRVQPLHPDVQAMMEQLPRSLSGFVFTYRGRPLGKKQVSRAWRRAAARAGIEVTCYQGTRHSLASQAINAGVDKALIGKFLGHKDPRSTDRYAHLLTETLKGVWEERPQTGPGATGASENLLKFQGKKT